MTEKKDDLGTWAVLGALGAAVVGLIASSLGNKNVNSYQASNSYSPPSQPSGGGCGCSAGR